MFSGSEGDYNLELSLGSLGSKRTSLEPMDEEGSIGMDQRVPMALELDWMRNSKAKVYMTICDPFDYLFGNFFCKS